MAHQSRKVDIIDVNRENVKPGKGLLARSQSLVSKRPALGEVGNKLHTQQNQVVKKAVALGLPHKPFRKKSDPTAEKNSKQTVCVKEVVQKHEASSTNDNIRAVKRVESLTLKPIKKIEKSVNPYTNSYSSTQLAGILNVDTSNDPLRVSEYVQDIYIYLLELEDKYTVKTNFLEGHRTSPRMRSILVNWMVEVHTNFKFLLETLHLSVAIVDRYLQINKDIGRETLQLVGTAAMLISGKYEEVYIPDTEDFVYICDDTFTAKQILDMEKDILKKLDFSFGRPIALHFLRRFNKIGSVRSEHHALGKYLVELALIDYDLCQYKPSLLAAAACCISIGILNQLSQPARAWSETLVHYSTYKYSDIESIVVNLACVINKSENSKLRAIPSKYALAANGKISLHLQLKGSLVRKLVSSKMNKK